MADVLERIGLEKQKIGAFRHLDSPKLRRLAEVLGHISCSGFDNLIRRWEPGPAPVASRGRWTLGLVQPALRCRGRDAFGVLPLEHEPVDARL